MPAGVSWPKYLKILTAAFLSMLAGAQTVHKFYKPDLVTGVARSVSLMLESPVDQEL
uniref:Uncharacterized protein n=1 Tax=Laticauda laticaudata TaxID=8630 RepID=A0A8C5SPF1_LATLA